MLRVPGFSPVVTFSYIDPGLEALTGFVSHLRQYQTLFRELGDFRFLYISGTPTHFEKATEFFHSQVKVPLESDIAADLIRYFRALNIWDQFGIQDHEQDRTAVSRTEPSGDLPAIIRDLFKNWKAGRIAEAELREEFPSKSTNRKVYFETYLVPKQPDFRAKDDESG